MTVGLFGEINDLDEEQWRDLCDLIVNIRQASTDKELTIYKPRSGKLKREILTDNTKGNN